MCALMHITVCHFGCMVCICTHECVREPVCAHVHVLAGAHARACVCHVCTVIINVDVDAYDCTWGRYARP